MFNLVLFFNCVFVLHIIVNEYLGWSCVMAKRQMCMLLLLDENDKWELNLNVGIELWFETLD